MPPKLKWVSPRGNRCTVWYPIYPNIKGRQNQLSASGDQMAACLLSMKTWCTWWGFLCSLFVCFAFDSCLCVWLESWTFSDGSIKTSYLSVDIESFQKSPYQSRVHFSTCTFLSSGSHWNSCSTAVTSSGSNRLCCRQIRSNVRKCLQVKKNVLELDAKVCSKSAGYKICFVLFFFRTVAKLRFWGDH